MGVFGKKIKEKPTIGQLEAQIKTLESTLKVEADLADERGKRIKELEGHLNSIRDYSEDTTLYTQPSKLWDSVDLIYKMANRALTKGE